MGYLMVKPSLEKNSSVTIQPIADENKGVHTFLKGISLKANVIVQLQFELTHYNIEVQYLIHHAIGTFPE